jgi:hypothetical protein
VVSHSGVTFFLLQGYPPKDDALIQVNIISYFRGLAYYNTGAVINEKVAADLCTGMYFDTRKKAVHMRKKPGTEQPSMYPKMVGDPMHPDGVESRITGKDFYGASRSGVFFEDCLYIFSYGFKKFHL